MHSGLQAELEHAHRGGAGVALAAPDDAGVDRTAAAVAVRGCVRRKSALITEVLEEDALELGPDDFPCVVLEHCPANASGRGCTQCNATFSMGEERVCVRHSATKIERYHPACFTRLHLASEDATPPPSPPPEHAKPSEPLLDAGESLLIVRLWLKSAHTAPDDQHLTMHPAGLAPLLRDMGGEYPREELDTLTRALAERTGRIRLEAFVRWWAGGGAA